MTVIKNGLRWQVTARVTENAMAEIHGYGDTPLKAMDHLRSVTRSLNEMSHDEEYLRDVFDRIAGKESG